jgi:hypothetical protein
MSEENEDLFEGLQIMSADEIESTINKEEEQEEETPAATAEEETIEKKDDLTITPASDTPPKKEEDEEDEETPPAKEEEEESEGEGASTVYSALIKELINEGVAIGPEDEEELKELLKDADIETLKKVMSSTVDKNFESKQESWKKSLSPEKKRFLQIEGAFDKVDAAIQMAQRIEFLDSMSTEVLEKDENLQQNIYFEYLKSKGFTDEEAVENVQEAIAVDKLAEKAAKAIPALKQQAENIVETSKAAREQAMTNAQEKQKESFEKLMSTIDEKDSFVPNLKLNKVSKDKVKQNITQSVWKDENGRDYTSLMYKQMRNPAEFEMLINYYDTIGLFNVDKEGNFKPDIAKLKAVAKTKAVSELDSVLRSESKEGVGLRNTKKPSEKSGDILSFLERATKK